MNFVQYIIYLFATLFLCTNTLNAQKWSGKYDQNAVIQRTIIVDQSGRGNFAKVQDAIDSVPSNNNAWVVIRLRRGVYWEKVSIPSDKQFIVMIGEGRTNTVIKWGDYGDSINSTTFSVLASNFVAMNIKFKNTYNKMLRPSITAKPVMWAPAILIKGDKSAFYNCAFISLQDTLTDMVGRHYFKSCYIEGAVDFIWGFGQSIYQDCIVNVTSAQLPGKRTGYITAQGRDSEQETNGYVFRFCTVTGNGPAFLGRAYRAYSRVIFYKSFLDKIVVPEGWDQWNQKGSDGLITFSEIGNHGPGSDMSRRVKWEKTLTPSILQIVTNDSAFINQDGWLQQQPISLRYEDPSQ